MSRFESWRFQEFSLLFNELIVTLRSGRNPEWANVFVHFGQELERLSRAPTGEPNELRRFLRSLRLCLAGSSGLSRLILEGTNLQEKELNNRRFRQLRARLGQALDEAEKKLFEFVN